MTALVHPRPRPRRRYRLLLTASILGGTALFAGVNRISPDFAALAREAIVSLPPPPAWASTAPGMSWSGEELQAEIGRITDTPPRLNVGPTRLRRLDHRWVAEFTRWFRTIQGPLKIRFQDQVWDCDDYANCFLAFADLVALKAAGSHGGLCLGRATVFYERPFAGIRAGGGHAVVLVGTTQGVQVIEPQDGTMVSLREFPNRHTVEEVNF